MTEQKKRNGNTLRREERPILCPPDAAGRSLGIRLLGMLCRLIVIFFAVAGLSTFLVSAFLPTVSLGSIVGMSALVVLVLGAMSLHPLAIAGGSIVSLAIIAYTMLSQPYPVSGYFERLIGHGVGAALDCLYARGYYSVILYKTEVPEGGSPAMFVHEFACLIVFLIALLFVPFLVRRVRVIVPAIVAVGCIVPVFMYNMTVDNFAMLMMISGFAGVLIMLAYDRCYNRKTVPSEYEGAELLFVDHRPPMPEGVKDKREAKKEHRELKRQAREQRRSRDELLTVEDELTDYFRAPAARAPKVKKEKVPKDKSEMQTAHRKQLRAVRRYDFVTAQSRAAMGGFAGVAMTLLAALMLLLPALTVQGAFTTIDRIDRRVGSYREYVTAVLRGDDPILDLYAYLEELEDREPHSTTAEQLEFLDVRLMNIGTQTNSNLYLPSFIGVDYAEGAWQYFNEDQYYAWRGLYEVEDMPSEQMFRDFIELMVPSMTWNEDYTTKYQKRSAYGFVVEMVNFKRQWGFSTDALLPRVYAESYGLLQYQSNEAFKLPFANVFDGICAGEKFAEGLPQYSAITYTHIQEDPNASVNRAKLIAMYNASVKEIERYDSTNKHRYEPNYEGTSYPGYESLAQRYIETMDPQQRKELLADFEAVKTYTDFVYQTYLDGADSAIIDAYAHTILTETTDKNGVVQDFSRAAERDSSDPLTYEQRHLLTMAVIDKLVLENTYTRTPTAETDATLDGVENFLTVTHEGYCVQFASAAALILRELGIPVRFVEGYMESEFELDSTTTEGGRYQAKLLDSDAHAWIEVWYDGIGWIVYETTPPYYVDMYGENSSTADSLIQGGVIPNPDTPILPPSDPVTPPEELPPPVEDPEDPTAEPPASSIDWAKIAKIGGIVLGAAAVLGVIAWLIVRWVLLAKRAEQKRQKLAEDIAAGAAYIFADEQSRADAAKSLVRQTMSLLSMYGTPPKTGELKTEYAHRLSFAYESVFGYPIEYSSEMGSALTREHISKMHIDTLMDAIAAEEFGYGMSPAAMKKLATFYLTLRPYAHRYIGAWERFVLHYIKRQL